MRGVGYGNEKAGYTTNRAEARVGLPWKGNQVEVKTCRLTTEMPLIRDPTIPSKP